MICTQCKTDKPTSDFYRSIKAKTGFQSQCKPCQGKNSNDWYARTRNDETLKARRLARSRKWNSAISQDETLKKRYREWKKDWIARHPEKAKAWYERYAQRYPAKMVAKVAARRARIKRAMPAWADEAAIEAIYVEARKMNELGQRVHVDHSVPLTSDFVCGLHVPWNLRIISASENTRKGNSCRDLASA